MEVATQRLVLVRHGESTRNAARAGQPYLHNAAARALLGDTPDRLIELTDAGREHARAARPGARGLGPYARVLHSGFARAAQTAQELVPGHELLEDPRLRERDSGYTSFLTVEEVREQFPYLEAYWAREGGWLARKPGGESLADVAERARSLVHELSALAGSTLLVTHAGTMRALRHVVEGWSLARSAAEASAPNPRHCHATWYERGGLGAPWELRGENVDLRAVGH